MQRIKVNLEVIEAMLYYWQATSEKEKVGEGYLNDIASMPSMKLIYDDEFNEESVRRALSAISNREIFTGESKKEGRFWNNNMWMLEDLDYTDMMVKPLKTLNLNFIMEKLNNSDNGSKYEEVEVTFVPGHLDEYKIIDNKLIINFFRVKPSLYDESTSIGEKELIDYIEEKILEILK
ncbi:TDE2712 family protein [Wukongibacter sp. M2B1]|uniref:TDE2712 family protein n=1 Tax=Wukongibacter sp. M2B1 TaxID=3088895 RepID=UPI003D7A8F09